jgi:probable F420-dependent oxidoreductase
MVLDFAIRLSTTPFQPSFTIGEIMDNKLYKGMKVGVFQVLTDMENGDPAIVAKHAEDLGFSSYWAPEHTVIPEGSADDYPGKEPGGSTPDYLFKMPDPLIALARASATTSTIELGTGITLLPERNPITTAKEMASLDHYSGGRFLLGIGAGWNKPECEVLGGDFEHRWTQTKENVAVMKALWTGEYVEHHGKYYDFPRLICKPKPARHPHPPILLGSIGTPLVFKRVAQWGDGWLPFCVDPQEIVDGRAELNSYAADFERDPKSLDITLFAPDGLFRTKADLNNVADSSANGIVLWLQGKDEKSILEELSQLADEIF